MLQASRTQEPVPLGSERQTATNKLTQRSNATAKSKTRKHSLISEHYDGIVEKMKMRRKGVPDYYYQLTEDQKDENQYIMQSMNKKINYLKNPRFQENHSPIFYADDVTSNLKDPVNPFRATPEKIVFRDYEIGEIYSARLTLVNADSVLRRLKFVPPKSDEFSLISVTYPTKEQGTVAPGMEVVFEILFKANSLSDYKDELIVISEKNNFVIDLVAFREQPELDLEQAIEVKSCWVGQKSTSTLQVKNKGGHAGFWVLAPSEVDRSQEFKPESFDNPGTKIVAPFSIHPDKFYLKKGEIVNFEIIFDPANEGKFTKTFYLGCDNLKVYEYTISAESNMIELKPITLDGTPLTEDCLPLQEIHFRDVELRNPVVKSFEIENLTKNKISYEWRVQDPNKQFNITPNIGSYMERERKTTSVEFVAGNLEACYAVVSLVIKDIPLESVRNPPQRILDSIKQMNAMSEAERKSQRIEFVYFSMTLFGEVAPLKYSVSPEYFVNPTTMPIHKPQEARYCIKNHSKCSSKFFLKLVSQSSEHLHTQVQGVFRSLDLAKVMEAYKSDDEVVNFFKQEGKKRKRTTFKEQVNFGLKRKSPPKLQKTGPTVVHEHPQPDMFYEEILPLGDGSYPIEAEQELDLYIKYWARAPLDSARVVFNLQYLDAFVTSLDLCASFSGTKLRICSPEVNFGVVKSFSQAEQEFEIENFSDVDAEILCRASGHQSFDMQMYKESIEEGDINTINYLFNNGPFVIEPLYQVVRAHSRGKVKVILKSEDTKVYTETLEVLPTHGEKLTVETMADVQDVHICLTRYFIEYQQLYSNRVYTMDREPQCIRMRNVGNLPSRFKWTVPHNPEILDAMVDPAEGVINPKSDILVRVKFSIKLYGKFTFYFKCDLDNMDLPLGFELTGTVVGLDIVYENMPSVDELALSRKKQLKKMQRNLSVTDKSMASTSKISGDGTSIKSSAAAPETSQPGPPLKSLDFLNLNINEPYTFLFKIRNLSGIQTHFRLNFDKYDASHVVRAHGAQLSLIESGVSAKDWESTSRNNKSFSRGFSINSDSVNKVKALTHTVTHHKKLKLLNEQVEQTHVFYSENGMKATKAKHAQKEAEDYLTIGKGVALVCDPIEGHLAAHSETTIKIKVYNELSGIFRDTLTCSIKGLDPVTFPTMMIIKGSPLKIPTDQVGLNIQSDPPILDFGGKLRDADPLEKTLKISNIGTQPLEVTLKIFNIDELDRNRDQFAIKIFEKSGDSNQLVDVKWDPIEPDHTSYNPFSLESLTVMVPPKSVVPLKVHYDSNEIRDYNSVLTITPKFKRVQKQPSGPMLGSDPEQGGFTAGSSAAGAHNSSLDASFAEMDLGLLSVLLRSRTLKPYLTLHEKPNLNGEISFKFDKWSVGRAPQQTRTILLLNQLPCHLYFQCVIQGAFSFLGNTSGAEDFSQDRIEDLITKNEAALTKAKQVGAKATERHYKKYKLLDNLDIVESSNMGVLLNFEGFDSQDYESWPNTRLHFVSGSLQVVFRNGETQDIKLEGWLYRPFLFLNSSGFEPCHDPTDPPTLDFGLLHIDDNKTLSIWLCNKSPVPAQWKIVYVPFPQKDYYGAQTVTALERENLEKMDDPEVFSLDVSEGSSPGCNIGVNMVPSGNAFWDRKDNHGVFKDLYPKKLKVMFKPKLNLLYKCKYKILVKGGPSIQFILKGRGSYEEKFKQKP